MAVNKLQGDIATPKRYTFLSAAGETTTGPFPAQSLPTGAYLLENTYADGSSAGTPRVAVNGTSYANGATIIAPTGIQSVQFTFDGSTWRTADLGGATTSTIVAGTNYNGTSYAVTASGAVFSSTDNLTWTSIGSNALVDTANGADTSLTYLGTRFFLLSGASAQSFRHSASGTTWTSVTHSGGSLNSRQRGAYGNGKYVLVHGSNSYYYYSTNGTTWTTNSGTLGVSASAIAFGNGMFIASADDGRIAFSTDGLAWFQRGMYIPPTATQAGNDLDTLGINSIVYVSGLSSYIAAQDAGSLGDAASFAQSTDGILWTSFGTPPVGAVNSLKSLTYLLGGYAVTNTGASLNDPRIWTSTDATTWTIPWNTSTLYNNVAATDGAGNYVGATAAGTSVRRYTNEFTSLANTITVSSAIGAIAYGNGLFVQVGDNAQLATSPTGATWTTRTSGLAATDDIKAVTYGGGKYVALTSQGTSTASTDGTTWTSSAATNHQGAPSYKVVAYGGGYYVGGIGSSVNLSTDGILWMPKVVPNDPTIIASLGTDLGTGTTGTVNLPTTGVAQNDLMVVAISSSGSAAAVPSGWTSAATAGGSTSDYIRVIYKVMGATPDTTVAITGISTASAAVAQAIRYADLVTSMDATGTTSLVTTAATGSTFPAITSVQNKSLIMAIVGKKSSTVFTAGAGYTNLAQQTRANQSVGMASAVVPLFGATTPASWTGTVTGTYVAVTLAVRSAGTVSAVADTSTPTALGYANGTFVMAQAGAVGSGLGAVQTSTDGLTWTSRNVATIGSGTINGLAYGNGTWVAVGATAAGAAAIARSTDDGASWSSGLAAWPSDTAPTSVGSVVWDGTYFVAQAGAYSAFPDNGSHTIISTDGSTWVIANGVANNSEYYTLKEVNGKIFAFAPANNNSGLSVAGLATSDTSVWRAFSSTGVNYTNEINDITYGGGKYVAVQHNSSQVSVSTDLITWSTANGTITGPHSVAYNGTSFRSYSSSSFSTSTDGNTWGSATSYSLTASKVDYVNNTYVAGTSTGLYTSTTGTGAWTLRVSGTNFSWEEFKYINSKYVAVGDFATVMSTDGVTWTNYLNRDLFGVGTSTVDLAYGMGKFVAVSRGLTAADSVSTDGITWTTGSINLASVTDLAIGTTIAAARDDVTGTVRVSTDLSTWYTVNQPAAAASATLGTLGDTLISGSATNDTAYILSTGDEKNMYASLYSYGQTIRQI